MKHLHDLPAWSKLWIHFDETKEQHMREMFDQDPERAERYWLQVGGLTLDYSKNRINDETMALLFELAREAGVPERMQQMFHGEKINTTENRAVLHVALRNRTNAPIVVDGEDVMPKVTMSCNAWRICTRSPQRQLVGLYQPSHHRRRQHRYRRLRPRSADDVYRAQTIRPSAFEHALRLQRGRLPTARRIIQGPP